LNAEKYSRELSDNIKKIFDVKPTMNSKEILIKSAEFNE